MVSRSDFCSGVSSAGVPLSFQLSRPAWRNPAPVPRGLGRVSPAGAPHSARLPRQGLAPARESVVEISVIVSLAYPSRRRTNPRMPDGIKNRAPSLSPRVRAVQRGALAPHSDVLARVGSDVFGAPSASGLPFPTYGRVGAAVIAPPLRRARAGGRMPELAVDLSFVDRLERSTPKFFRHDAVPPVALPTRHHRPPVWPPFIHAFCCHDDAERLRLLQINFSRRRAALAPAWAPVSASRRSSAASTDVPMLDGKVGRRSIWRRTSGGASL